jgi:type I restriction enzyme, S subunit
MKLNKTKLDKKLTIKHGYPFKGDFFSNKGKYIVLTPGNFYESGGFKRELGKEKFYSEDFPEEYLHKKNDLIVAMTEQAEGLLGSMAFVPKDDLYLHNQRLGLVTIDEKHLDKNFLYYLFQSNYVRKQIRNSSSGTKVKHTSPEKIYDLIVFLPDTVDKQKRIGNLLSFIDKKIDLNNKINNELESMAKMLYNYWFIQFDFPNNDGKPYKSSGGKMEYNKELKRAIPKGWDVKKLKDLVTKNIIPFNSNNDDIDTIDLSVMQSKSLCLNYKNKSSNFSTNLFIMKKYDILFGSIRPYLFKAGFAPFAGLNAGTVHSYNVLNQDTYNFTLLTFTHPSVFNYAIANSKGTKMPVIGSDDLLSYKVPYNEDIITRFNSILTFKELISTNILQNQELTKLRDWLLPMLMNGQVSIK